MYAVTEFVLTTKNKYGGLLDFVINNSRSFDMIQTLSSHRLNAGQLGSLQWLSGSYVTLIHTALWALLLVAVL